MYIVLLKQKLSNMVDVGKNERIYPFGDENVLQSALSGMTNLSKFVLYMQEKLCRCTIIRKLCALHTNRICILKCLLLSPNCKVNVYPLYLFKIDTNHSNVYESFSVQFFLLKPNN